MAKALYEQARPQIDRLQQMVAEAKRPVVQVPSPAVPPAPTTDLAAELQRLGDLHSQGILDAEEFKAAKQAAIARSAAA
jgi:hypothetical protein